MVGWLGGGVSSCYNRGTVVVTDGSHSPSLTAPVQHALGRLHLPVPLNPRRLTATFEKPRSHTKVNVSSNAGLVSYTLSILIMVLDDCRILPSLHTS